MTDDDARMVAAAGADAIGLNFYPRSPRYITQDRAEAIIAALPAGVVKVGVFVNATADTILATASQLKLDLVQLHGDEPPELLAALIGVQAIRAFRLGTDGFRPVEDYLDRCRRLDCLPQTILIDSYRKGAYGGTGQVADWNSLRAWSTTARLPPLVLAGGLTPANVAEAIGVVQPAAVDTASGVESRPGCKDPALVAAFVRAAREAFDMA